MNNCELCKKKVEHTTRRHVAVKKCMLQICDDCITGTINYDPADFIEEGDTFIK